ncbi:MAG: HNH endonuclease signature motif containing protein, partial [Pseudomonadota bacterium]
RDGGCRFPGCTSTRHCHGHHIEHWQHGGETSLDNLVLLCPYHHRLVHEGGFDCRKSESGEVYFVDRRHERLPEHEPPSSASIAASLGWMIRRFGGLHRDTCTARMQAGDDIDWDHAMLVAFQDRPGLPTLPP